jgi:hypothetical protein
MLRDWEKVLGSRFNIGPATLARKGAEEVLDHEIIISHKNSREKKIFIYTIGCQYWYDVSLDGVNFQLATLAFIAMERLEMGFAEVIMSTSPSANVKSDP